jgi:hypothetical protein
VEVLPVWQQAGDGQLRHRLYPERWQRAQLVYPLDDEGLPWLHMGEGENMKTVIEMAREAGFPFNKYGLLQGNDENEIDADAMLERFAELVRADAIADAVEREREACMNALNALPYQRSTKYDCMDAIRNRSNT